MGTLKPALWDSQVCFLSFLRLLSVFQQLEQLRRAVSPTPAPSKRLQPGAVEEEGVAKGGNKFPQGFQAVLAPVAKRDQRQHMKSQRCL